MVVGGQIQMISGRMIGLLTTQSAALNTFCQLLPFVEDDNVRSHPPGRLAEGCCGSVRTLLSLLNLVLSVLSAPVRLKGQQTADVNFFFFFFFPKQHSSSHVSYFFLISYLLSHNDKIQ